MKDAITQMSGLLNPKPNADRIVRYEVRRTISHKPWSSHTTLDLARQAQRAAKVETGYTFSVYAVHGSGKVSGPY